MDHLSYQIVQWRKRLERRGWISLRRQRPPRNRLVEYHVIWQRRLISGRVRLQDLDASRGYWEPGTPVYLLERCMDVEEGVWRLARKEGAAVGQVMRRLET